MERSYPDDEGLKCRRHNPNWTNAGCRDGKLGSFAIQSQATCLDPTRIGPEELHGGGHIGGIDENNNNRNADRDNISCRNVLVSTLKRLFCKEEKDNPKRFWKRF